MANGRNLLRSIRPARAFKLETNMAIAAGWKLVAAMSALWIGRVDCAGILNENQSNGPMERCGRERRLVAGICAGTWYLNGDSGKRVEIISSRDGLQAKNERGHTTRLQTDHDGDIRALDWEGGLRGDVKRDRIEWQNGTTWTRSSH